MVKAHTVACPRCGGTLTWFPGQSLMRCDYCGGLNILAGSENISRYSMSPRVSSKEAMNIARKILHSTSGVATGVRREARLGTPELYFVPMYDIHGLRVGKMLIKERKNIPYQKYYIPNVGAAEIRQSASLQLKRNMRMTNRNQTHKEDTRIIMNDIQMDAPAVSMPGWGVEFLRLSKLRKAKSAPELEPFDIRSLQKLGTVISPGISPEHFLETEFGHFVKNDNRESRLLDREISIIYYPLWRVAYTYHGIPYHITIDGITGERLYARFPQGESRRIALFLGGVGVLGFILGIFLFIFLLHDQISKEVFKSGFQIAWLFTAFSGPSIALVLAYLWLQLRYPGEIIYTGEYSSTVRVGKTGETFADKVIKEIKYRYGRRDI